MPSLTDEQKNAIQSTDEHVLVSAGAGSGKTLVLVERYIEVLWQDEDAGVNEIIAVTFTRKAADEMRNRLKARLKELSATSAPAQRLRWLQCLSEVETARIGTIHSLCESILKNYPAEAGIDPGFEIMDDLQRAELRAASIDDTLHSVIERPLEFFGELLEYPIESLRGWLEQFLSNPLKYKEARERLGDCSPEAMQSFADKFIEADIKRTLNEILTDKDYMSEYLYLNDNAWSAPESKLGLLQSEMLSHLNVLVDRKNHGDRERFQALHSLGSMESARNAGGPAAQELRKCMRTLRATAQKLSTRHKLDLNNADKLAFNLLRALITLADHAFSRYEAIKHLNQKLDFDDLIERCQRLLAGERPSRQTTLASPTDPRSGGTALKQLSRNLRAVLVDEFQDTNWTQTRLLTALASSQAKLFLIGDDKQSIYKFQGADVSTFNTCKTYVSSLGSESDSVPGICAKQSGSLPLLPGKGKVLALSQSFRSHPQLVNFVNHLFYSLFNAEPDAEEFKSRFQALRPARTATDGDECPHIDIIYTPHIDETEADAGQYLNQIEAQLTADWIQEKIAASAPVFDKQRNCCRPIAYSDFAVLLQANNEFAAIEKALADAGIPHVSIAGSGFLDRQEILDLENILKWLVCPQDSHALFAVLRSPVFGFSDDILHELKAGKQTSLWQNLATKAKEGDAQKDLQKAWRLLQSWQREAGSLALPDLLRRIVLASGYDMILLCTESGKQKSRNLFKFLSLSAGHKDMSIREFLSSLNSMRELNVKNLTDAPLSAENAVKIMTIHKSKGLEFGAVALPRLGRSVYQRPNKLLFGKDLSIAFDCTRDPDEEKPAFFTAANNLSRKMDEEEKKRLLYVAVTRARDYLGLFITPHSLRGTNFANWLIQALDLPEVDGVIETQIMSAGAQSERCFWSLRQAPARTAAAGKPALSAAAPSPGAESSLSEPFLECDSSLLDSCAEPPQTFVPVPWQALLRVCPEAEGVHATIAGNYFHLLMSSLGPDLQLPSEKNRRALLLSHEVAVHDSSQQEQLLRDSERLLIAFKNSSLFKLMRTARRRIAESAYLISRNGQEEELRPDLIIEDAEGGWHIVDYKTDQVEIRQLSRQISVHQGQLSRYVTDLETLLGVEAKAWIYFAQIGRLEPVDPSGPAQLSLF